MGIFFDLAFFGAIIAGIVTIFAYPYLRQFRFLPHGGKVAATYWGCYNQPSPGERPAMHSFKFKKPTFKEMLSAESTIYPGDEVIKVLRK